MTGKSRLIMAGLSLLLVTSLRAQMPEVDVYITTYADLAMREMQRTGIPASITLAQGILETEAGKSILVKKSNNHFGIKCKSYWKGEKVYHDDDARGECFRAYSAAEDSYRDHSDFLKAGRHYAFLFDIDPEDYKAWAHGLKKAGYATNPKYPQILIRYIEQYNLQDYTLVALGKKKKSDLVVYAFQKTEEPAGEFSSISAINIHSAPADSTGAQAAAPKPSYPANEFRINDTRVVFATAGTSLLALAEKYQVRYKHLIDFNDMNREQDLLLADQLIFLQRKRRQGAADHHIVLPGETLYDIAQQEGIRLGNLAALNSLDANARPATGQKIYLRDKAPEPPLLAAAPGLPIQETIQTETVVEPENTAKPIRHVVQTKETLFGIARKYEVTEEEIREWNQLDLSSEIKVGQSLIIYKKG